MSKSWKPWTSLKVLRIWSQIPSFIFFIDLDILFDREKEKLPSLDDVEGAAYGLVRLVNLYQLNLTSFIENGIIDTTLENGQVVYSKPSVVKPTCELRKLPNSSYLMRDIVRDLTD